MPRPKPQTYLIEAPAGKLEVEALWQNDDPQDANTDTLALLCHPHPLMDGTMTNTVVTTMFRFARDNGMHAIRFNFRGVGQSTGEHDYARGEIDDAMTVLQWASGLTPARKLWLGGFSFGGYITGRVAEQMTQTPHVWGLSDFELKKVALIAPSVEKEDVSDLELPTEKTLMIYGDADEVIAPASMAKFAVDKGIERHIIKHASHFFHGQLGELKDILNEFAQP